MKRSEKIIWATPLIAVAIGFLFFGMQALVLALLVPFSIFLPIIGFVWFSSGERVTELLGIANPMIRDCFALVLPTAWLLFLVFIAARAKDRDDSRLSLLFLVLATITYLLPLVLIPAQ